MKEIFKYNEFADSAMLYGFTKKNKNKLMEMVYNTVHFFKKNKDKKEDLLSFLTFIIRLSLMIQLVASLALVGRTNSSDQFLGESIVIVFLFLIARFLALLSLWIGGFILNISARLVLGKDNVLAARRVVAYSSIASLIPDIGLVSVLGFAIGIVLETIGVREQYKTTTGSALFAVLLPLLVIGGIAAFIVAGFFLKAGA